MEFKLKLFVFCCISIVGIAVYQSWFRVAKKPTVLHPPFEQELEHVHIEEKVAPPPSPSNQLDVQNLSLEENSNFNWQDYLELNSDLRRNGVVSKQKAIDHYLKSGKREGRPAFREKPIETTLIDKIALDIKEMLRFGTNIPVNQRTMIVFHVGVVDSYDSIDVLINNIKIFSSSLATRKRPGKHKTVYLFNVMGGRNNPLYNFLPPTGPNVLVNEIEGNHVHLSSSMEQHMKTLFALGEETVAQFGTIIFLNEFARGPLVRRKEGDWIQEYRKLLELRPHDIALVSSVITCDAFDEKQAQNHAFALRGNVASSVARQMLDPVHSSFLTTKHTLVDLVKNVLRYNVSSILHTKRLHNAIYNHNTCNVMSVAPTAANRAVYTPRDPFTWCDLSGSDVVFMKWGGNMLNVPGYVCDGLVSNMRRTLVALANAEDSNGHQTTDGGHNRLMDLIVPETLRGGILYDLYKQYNMEIFASQNGFNLSSRAPLVSTHDSKLCLLVRTTSIHDLAEDNGPDSYEGLFGIIRSLLSQTNPNWLAFFFVTDDRPFDARLQEVLAKFRDNRLRYVNIDPTPRLKFTVMDAGFTATDHVLRYVSQQCPECKWITVTNGDNAYGTEVTLRTLAVDTHKESSPSMLLHPLDSRNFAEQDYQYREEKTVYSNRCTGIRAMLRSNLMAYCVQGIPLLGKVDLAAVFILRTQFLKENLLFGNFTNPAKYPCLGCQDGYLTEYLVRNRLWKYARLPIDGLKSMVFHGPSPTLCIASGNVWFDHPLVNKVGCFSHRTLHQLKTIDDVSHNPRFDWDHFTKREGRICVRLSQQAFTNETTLRLNNL